VATTRTEREPAVIPPHNLDVERAILGAILLEGRAALSRVRDTLKVTDFYTEAHRLIYQEMLAVFERGEHVDVLILTEALRQRDTLALVGGQAALALLVEQGSITAYLNSYVSLVRGLAARRAMIQTAHQIEARAFTATHEPAAIADDAARALADVATRVYTGRDTGYIQSIADFLAEPDLPVTTIFPDLLPTGVTMLLHGEPRSRKSLTAFEFALAAATGTAPFGLARFAPNQPVRVLYIQEEDPRSLTRTRLQALVRARCGDTLPDTLHVAIQRGVDLDDPMWVARLIDDLTRLEIKVLVLDAARRLSTKSDAGPDKVRELIAELQALIRRAGVTIIIVHHDVKPPVTGQDQRRRSQRASGGDWFAGCECPVHVEKIGERTSLVFPTDYKFGDDPAPFEFSYTVEQGLITGFTAVERTKEDAERAGVQGKILDWLRVNGLATKTAMKRAGLGQWEAIETALERLLKLGLVDAAPGRQQGSFRYFIPSRESSK